MIENQEIYIDSEEEIVEAIGASEKQEDVTLEETVEVIDSSEVEVITVDIDEAFTALGESNDFLKHSLLNGRELPDQHPITAITGLRSELDEIEALKTVYSNDKNYANYYMWQDENPSRENRGGFFVSLCPTTNKIKICDFDEDTEAVSEVFGVTVDSAGFIGGQDDIARDDKYGLVVCNGVVAVRCETDVAVGDYVVPNRHGVAERAMCAVINNTGTKIEVDGQCGYLVVALDNTSGVSYADIIFEVSAKQLNNLENSIHEFNVRIDNTERNITSAINVANEAYYLASNLGDIGKLNADTVEKANDALEKAEQALGTTSSQSKQIAEAKKASEQAKIIAQSASAFAESARSEAVATANDALAKTNNLIDELEPIATWTDEDGNTGATYFVEYINDGVATKTEVETVSTFTEELLLEVQKNAKGLQTLIANVDKYSLGEYSQAYGLTWGQAKSILDNEMIYVPTVDHSETYEGSPHQASSFSKGFSYRWVQHRGQWTTITTSPCAMFSSEYVTGNGTSAQFWVIEGKTSVTYEDITYESKTLYMWQDGRWVAVAGLKDNVNNRINSMLTQTTNSISAEIANARGSFTGLDLRLGDVDSRLNLTTFWKDPTSNLSNLAAVQLNSDDDSSSLALVVMGKEGDQQISGASIVLGQDGANPYISLDADYINLEGFTTINNSFTIDENGYMIATGGTIGGWKITNLNGVPYIGTDWNDNGKLPIFLSQSGMEAYVGFIKSYRKCVLYSRGNFAVTDEGQLYAATGRIGDWEISTTYNANNDSYTSYLGTSEGSPIFLSQSGISAWVNNTNGYKTCVIYAKGNFAVDTDGKVYATGGNIGGWELKRTSEGVPYIGTVGQDANLSDAFILAQGGVNIWSPSLNGSGTSNWFIFAGDKFGVTSGGVLYAQGAQITGNITATSGNFSRDVTIGGRSISNWITEQGYINEIQATKGTFGDWHIGEGDYASSMWAEHKPLGTLLSTVYLTPELVRVKKNNSTSASATWENIANSATQYALVAANDDSDANIKNSIAELDEKYEVLFDSLTPCRYKYNFGTSDRYHTGFIAQEVIQALDNADLTTSDFAAVMKYQEPDEYGSEYGLRRDEFVALNTWQIQKLKKRVAELEAKLEQKEI